VKPIIPPRRFLRLLFWETTVRCNLACAHCRRLESNEAEAADLSTAQAQDLIAQLAQLGRRQSQHSGGVPPLPPAAGLSHPGAVAATMGSAGPRQDVCAGSASGPPMPVLVFSGGEPLCRSDLFHLVDVARQHGIVPALATNGTLIDGGRARQIREAGVMRVSVSLDGATAETHDRMRQIPGSFDGALSGIRHLHKEQVPFQINMTLTKQNAGQLQQVYELARSLGAVAVHLFMLVPVGCGEVLAETDMLAPQAYEQVMREIFALESRGQMQIKVTCGPHYERVKRQMLTAVHGVPPGAHKETSHSVSISGHGASKGCLAGSGVLFVSHRGDVYPCGYLPIDCGNVREQRLVEIWDKSEDLARMQDVTALEGKCGVCGYKRVCGGCRARAFAATGNYMAEEPFCVYFPGASNRPIAFEAPPTVR
jgi:radical SAM protein with 4Fe4S-binding SPASM domain